MRAGADATVAGGEVVEDTSEKQNRPEERPERRIRDGS
jgi:hypothetical protein